jgi:hypothetical protein
MNPRLIEKDDAESDSLSYIAASFIPLGKLAEEVASFTGFLRARKLYLFAGGHHPPNHAPSRFSALAQRISFFLIFDRFSRLSSSLPAKQARLGNKFEFFCLTSLILMRKLYL